MSAKAVQPDEKVPFKLTAAERKLVLDDLKGIHPSFAQVFRETPAGEPAMMPFEDLDAFAWFLDEACEACDDPRVLDKAHDLIRKIDDLLEQYTDDEDDGFRAEQAGQTLVEIMRSILKDSPEEAEQLPPAKAPQRQRDKFSIKLTALQRQALVSATRLKAALKRRLEAVSEGTRSVPFTSKELHSMQDELGQAAVVAPSPYKSRLVAVLKKVDKVLFEATPADSKIDPSIQKRPETTADMLLQFKVTLLDIEPPIWRRIQIRDTELGDLHCHIQSAFGWWNYHMHLFETNGRLYGPRAPEDMGFMDFGPETVDEDCVMVSELLPRPGEKSRWIYEYDFGDGWRHEVVFEGYPPADKKTKYPVCSDGARACPPEDVGGPWGFADYLEAIADPTHQQHADFMEWRGPFDRDAFDAKKATREMRKTASQL